MTTEINALRDTLRASLIERESEIEAALLGLFFLFAPTGKRKLGETDAHWNRG